MRGVSRLSPRVEVGAPGQGGSRPRPRGEVGGSGWGGVQALGASRHTPGGSKPRPRGVYPSMHLDRHPPSPQQTATAAGDTHPTGMHSCFLLF